MFFKLRNLTNRSYEAELLDAENIPTEDLFQNLRELAFINKFLGGHKVILDGIKSFFKSKQTISILEIGSGGGDNLRAVQKHFPEATLFGVDLKATCTEFAVGTSRQQLFAQNSLEEERRFNRDDASFPSRRTGLEVKSIQFITSDYRLFKPDNQVDIVFNSLFCHHFTDEQLVDMLVWMKQNSRLGFVIGDLHRHWLAYYLIKVLSALFSKSYLLKNDAPLSVARGFKQSEWRILLQKAGIENYKIEWKWAFRHLIVVKHEKN